MLRKFRFFLGGNSFNVSRVDMFTFDHLKVLLPTVSEEVPQFQWRNVLVDKVKVSKSLIIKVWKFYKDGQTICIIYWNNFGIYMINFDCIAINNKSICMHMSIWSSGWPRNTILAHREMLGRLEVLIHEYLHASVVRHDGCIAEGFDELLHIFHRLLVRLAAHLL